MCRLIHKSFRTTQDLIDRSDVKTTLIYPHVLDRGGCSVISPLDA